MRKAIFLDKDGTLIPDVPYNVDPSRMRLSPGAGEALHKLQKLGYLLIVISNQAGVAKGFFPESAIKPMFEHLKRMFVPYKVRLEAFYYCPHHPEGRVKKYAIVCECRKPQPGLLDRAIADYDIDPKNSWMIGDILDDVEAGARAGIRTILLDPYRTETPSDVSYRQPDFIASSFEDAYKTITKGELSEDGTLPVPPQKHSMDRLLQAIQSFKQSRALLIGDAALDRYLKGAATRLNREAPVPIVDIQRETAAPGCAANVAVNIAHLGGHVRFLSVTGADASGDQLRALLARAGVDTSTMVIDANRQTLCKQRVIGGEHMYVRFDTGTTTPLTRAAEELLLRHLDRHYSSSDSIIISDYGYGILTPRIIARLFELRRDTHKPLLVDSKFLPHYRELVPTIVKPNFEEARQLVGLIAPTQNRASHMIEHQHRLFEATGAEAIAVTLDAEGSLLLKRGGAPYHVRTDAVDNTKAIGAGDTYASTLLLAYTANLSLEEASRIAASAAAIVVQKDGTATCTNRELQFYFASRSKRLPPSSPMQLLNEGYKAAGKRIVFTNGCFDILHSGHIAYLAKAKRLGDVLIVGINTDESVRRLKGETRPVNTLSDRMRVLSGLASVDHVIGFAEDTAEQLVATLQPDVYVKGGDYSKETLPEAHIVEGYGGRVEIIPMIPGKSTSTIIEKIQMRSPLTYHY